MRPTTMLAVGFATVMLAGGAAGADDTQNVSGTIVAPTAGRCSEWTEVAMNLASRYGLNGVSHYFVDVARGTRGDPFRLTSQSTAADLDITFVGDGRARNFRTRGPVETGRVPGWAERAWVCAYMGAHVDFDYRAG